MEVRVPGPPASLTQGLARDFSRLPIEVYVLPAGYDAGAQKAVRVEAQVVDATLLRGIGDGPAFARVTFAREALQPGALIVAQRRMRAGSGEAVVGQTRCGIRSEDAGAWR